MDNTNQKRIYLIIKILISLSLLVFLFRIKLDVHDLIMVLQHASILLIAASLIPTLLIVLIKTLKWQMLVSNSSMHPLTYKESLFSFLFGLAPGLATPGRVGEVLRISLLSNIPKAKLAELFMIDKYIELSTLFFAAALGSYLMKLNAVFGITAGLFVLCIVFFMLRERWVPPFLRLISGIIHRNITLEFHNISSKHFFIYFVLSAMALFLDIFTFFLIVNSFKNFSFIASMITFPLILIAAVLPISISGIGVRETVTIYLLTSFAISSEISFGASLLIFFVGSLLPALAGQLLFLLCRTKEDNW